MRSDSKKLMKRAVWLAIGLAVAYFALPTARTFILISAPFLLAIFFVMKGLIDNKKDESAKPGESKAVSGVCNADQNKV